MFLRIQVTNHRLGQLLHQPGNTTAPRYDLVLNFPNAVLADVNAAPLFTGAVIARIIPSAVDPITLTIISQLLHPFSGYFELDVEGTYSIDPAFAEITAGIIHACNIQPALP